MSFLRLNLVTATLAIFCCGLVDSAMATTPVPREEAESLKKQIRAIALANLADADVEGQLLPSLAPLVLKLVALNEVLDDPEQALERASGAWKQIYSDDFNGSQLDRDQIFQVVLPRGVFFNFGSPVGQSGRFSSLRGEYKATGNQFDVEFVDFGFIPIDITPQVDLEFLARVLEAGWLPVEALPPSVPSPVGVQGRLTNLYVDEDFRIAVGFSANGATPNLFILDRVREPIRYLTP